MKKLLLALILCLAGSLKAQETIVYNLTPNATGIATGITNTTDGAITIISNPKDTCRIYVTGTTTQSTTNGNFVVRFRTASGSSSITNEFDTTVFTQIKLTFPTTLVNGTNTMSDWFQIRGVRYIKIGRMENTTEALITNITVRVSTSSGGQQ